jgi:hypothetical protein
VGRSLTFGCRILNGEEKLADYADYIESARQISLKRAFLKITILVPIFVWVIPLAYMFPYYILVDVVQKDC